LPGESSFWQRYILVLSGTSHIVFLVWLYTTKHRCFKTCCICVPYFSDTPILHRYSDTRIAGVSHFPTLKKKEKNADTPTILQRYSDDTWNLRSTDTSKPLLAFSFLVCYWLWRGLFLVLSIPGVRYRRHVIRRQWHGRQPVFFWW
jgi:hypothetical protein